MLALAHGLGDEFAPSRLGVTKQLPGQIEFDAPIAPTPMWWSS
jgi:hypothetical protein